MRIIREGIPTVDNFTVVPNKWARDERLTRKARGLLVELLSHREGWESSVQSLARKGREGRDAIRASVQELERYGYLERQQSFDAGGKFTRGTYILRDPDTVGGKSAHFPTVDSIGAGHTVDGLTVNGSPSSDYPTTDNPAPKKTNSKKTKNNGASVDAPVRNVYPEDFETFWSHYPKRQGPNPKKPAHGKWSVAIKTTDPQTIITAVKAYAASELPDDRRMIPQAQNWLSQARWEEHAQESVDPIEWARNAWTAGDVSAVTDRTGLLFPGVQWESRPDPNEKDRLALQQKRDWIADNHDEIVRRLQRA